METGFSHLFVAKETNSTKHNYLTAYTYLKSKASLVAQSVKNPSAMQETWVRFLGWEDPLEEGMATHCSNLAWRIPMDRGALWAIVLGVGKNWT